MKTLAIIAFLFLVLRSTICLDRIADAHERNNRLLRQLVSDHRAFGPR